MDTTPFHLILLALDILLLGGLFLWIRCRRRTGSIHSAVHPYENALYVPSAVPYRPSFIWDVTGVILFGGFGVVCFAVLSWFISTNYAQTHIYHFNVGQCIVEGIAMHGTLFFLGTAALLYWNHQRVLALFFGCCTVGLAGVGFDALYWEPYHLSVEYYEIKTSKIKKPLRIVFVTDIQTDRIGFHEINTVKTIQRLEADMIIFGGDYIQTFQNTREKHLPEKFRQMLLDHPLKAPLGVYAIAGNVGGNFEERDANLFKGTGVEFFQDSTIFEGLGADQNLGPIDLVILRVSDSEGGRGDYYLTDSGNFTVMAGHYPNYAIDGYKNATSGKSLSGYRNAKRAPDLMLAGHTHGGQIVIPFYGTLAHPQDERLNQVPRFMWSGFFVYPNGGHLVVSRGSGMERGWAPRVRLFCPPEISVIDIVPE